MSSKGKKEPEKAAPEPPKPVARGHKQRGAGTVIVAKAPMVTHDGIVLKAHERLPCQVLQEYCQREKRPNPKYYQNPPGHRFKVVLEDTKNSKNDLSYLPTSGAESDKVAKDYAALLALFHLQRDIPLERKLPEPYCTTWMHMIKGGEGGEGGGGSSATKATKASKEAEEEEVEVYVKPQAFEKKKKAPPPLDKTTADWLCDQCNAQNFAKLLSGVMRLKCFKCQAPKSESCTYVDPLDSVPAAGGGSAASSERSTPKAIMDLKSVHQYASKAEAENVKLEEKRKNTSKRSYWDAIKLANRPNPVFLSLRLRKYIEEILGIESQQSVSGTGVVADLKAIMQGIRQDGLLFKKVGCWSPALPLARQIEVTRSVVRSLKAQGFQDAAIAQSLQALLSDKGADLRDELEELEPKEGLGETFSEYEAAMRSYISDSCLEFLCLYVDESQLPQMFDASNHKVVSKAVVSFSSNSNSSIHSSSSSSSSSSNSSSSGSQIATFAEALTLESLKARVVFADLFETCGWSKEQADAALALFASKASVESPLLQTLALWVSSAVCVLPDTSDVASTAITYGFALKQLQDAVASKAPLILGLSDCGSDDLIAAESEALVSIYAGSVAYVHEAAKGYHRFVIQLDRLSNSNHPIFREPTFLDVIVPNCTSYPENPPFIAIRNRQITAKFSENKSMLTYIQSMVWSKSLEMCGDMMLYNIASYVEENLASWVGLSSADSSDLCKATERLQRRTVPFIGIMKGALLIGEGTSKIDEVVQQLESGLIGLEGQANDSVEDEKEIENETDNDTFTDSGSVASSSSMASLSSSATMSNSSMISKASKGKQGGVAKAATGSGGNREDNSTKVEYLHPFWSRSPSQQKGSTSTKPTEPTKAQREMLDYRKNLPAHQARDLFLNTLATNRGVIVTGETGCGKTTQIPQFILECQPGAKIVVCQPRRLAAIGVATRIAEEMDTTIGDKVGYMVRGDCKVSKSTVLVFCTYGVMLRRLQSDPCLDAIDYVIFDEVHERNLDSDFSLALLMSSLRKRATLKIILMSATIATEKFAAYLGKFANKDGTPSPLVHIPGITFPVTEFYRKDFETAIYEITDMLYERMSIRTGDDDFDDDEDGYDAVERRSSRGKSGEGYYDMISRLVVCLAVGGKGLQRLLGEAAPIALRNGEKSLMQMLASASGTILIFMPGVAEITKLIQSIGDALACCRSPDDSVVIPKATLIPLHGALPPQDQKRVFIPARRGELKIVVATNVAEASITIPDATVVVDSCRVKEIDFDTKLSAASLVSRLASKDSLRQRRGRAGRVQEGRCFRIISEATFQGLPSFSVPEIMRVPLDSLVLQVKAMNFGGLSTEEVLRDCLDRPPVDMIKLAETKLQELQALDEGFVLTGLGKHLSHLPCDPQAGKMLVFGSVLGCLFSASCLAASVGAKSPWLSSSDEATRRKVDQAKASFMQRAKHWSDHMVVATAMKLFVASSSPRDFCRQHGLSMERMVELKELQRDLLQNLSVLGLVASAKSGLDLASSCNAHESDAKVLAALVCAGFYPQIAKVLRPPAKYHKAAGMGTQLLETDAKDIKFYMLDKKFQEKATSDKKSEKATPGEVREEREGDSDISIVGLTRIFIHPSSVNFKNTTYSSSNYIVYSEITTSSAFGQQLSEKGTANQKAFIRESTEVPPLALLFLGGKIDVQFAEQTATVDKWVKFCAPGRVIALVLACRRAVDELLVLAFSQRDRHPDQDVGAMIRASPVVQAIVDAMSCNGMDAKV